jgi:hypothetical protein
MRKALVGHPCATAQRKGWDAITNGELIRLAEAEFGVSATSDQNIRYQQNLAGRRIAILELSTNDVRRVGRRGDEKAISLSHRDRGQATGTKRLPLDAFTLLCLNSLHENDP